MSKLKLGLVGVGYIGKTHLRNAKLLENTDLTAVADKAKTSQKYAKEMGIDNVYEDYKEMLDKADIEAVLVGLPNFLHLECAEYAAELGKHILMEKPLARNPEEGKKILDVAEKNNVKLMVGYPLRFSDYLIEAKKFIDDGELGFVKNIHAVKVGVGPYFHRDSEGHPVRVPEWWFSKELTGGGVLLDTGVHMINLLRWYFGDITKIYGAFGYNYSLEVEDQAICTMEFENGTRGCLTLNWTSNKDHTSIDLYGTTSSKSIFKKPTSKPITALQMLLGTSKFYLPFMREIENFSDAVLNDDLPEPSGLDGYKDLVAIDKAYNNIITIFDSN